MKQLTRISGIVNYAQDRDDTEVIFYLLQNVCGLFLNHDHPVTTTVTITKS